MRAQRFSLFRLFYNASAIRRRPSAPGMGRDHGHLRSTGKWLQTLAALIFTSLLVMFSSTASAVTFCSATVPADIVAQAAALKNDPDLIYEFVYNKIQTVPQNGSLKGPLGTLLDGAGTAVDQAELMASLLQAAGYTTAAYQVGNITISAAHLTAWLGTDSSTYYSAGYAMLRGGFGDTTATVDMSGTLLYVTVRWAWVKVQIGGTNYVFDPAGKRVNGYTRSSGIANLATDALKYSQSSFLNSAEIGTTLTDRSVTGLNRNNIRNNLGTLSQNLVSYIRANNPTATPADIVGGTVIVPLAVGTQQRITASTNLSYLSGTPTDYSCLPSSLRTTVSITVPNAGGAVTFNTSDIYGHRLSLFFDSGIHPILRLDGATEATGSAVSDGTPVALTVSITHPYATTFADLPNDQSLKVTASAAGAFLISNGWGPVGRGMIEKHRSLLQQNTAQNPGNPNAESVLGESLAVLGYTWLAEGAQAQLLIDQLTGTVTVDHHAMGIVGIKSVGTTGPFVDLPLNGRSHTQRTSHPSSGAITPLESAVFFTRAEMSSILESGAIEQTQPGAVAVSTAKIVDIASQSDTIYDINNSAINGDDASYYTNTIRGMLDDTWLGGDLSRVDTLVNTNNKRVIAPLIGNVTVNGLWTGVGYYQISQAGDVVGAIITGGLSGGFSATQIPNSALNSNTASSFLTSSLSALYAKASQGLSKFFGTVSDPVNRVTGSFTYNHLDLSVGSAGFPLGLAFARSYDSAIYLKNGPLGLGWTHNFSITAQKDSDGFEGMAANSPIGGASAIAALYVMQDILNQVTSTAKPLDRMVIADIAVAWLMEQLTNNVVIVTEPGNVSSFALLADGSTYNPPFGSSDTLKLSSGAYTLTQKDGTVVSFNGSGSSAPGSIASWHSPAGPTVTYTYNDSGYLTSVSTGTGAAGTNRTLTLSYNGSNQLTTVATTVADGPDRSVSYTYSSGGSLSEYTDSLGNKTTYTYDPANPGRMTQYFKPSVGGAFISNTYDDLGRVITQTDANGNTTSLYVAGTRTEITDALAGC